MRSWIAASLTLLAMTPLAAHAEVVVTKQTLLKGTYKLSACEAGVVSPECVCDVDISYPQLQGLVNKEAEAALNTLLKSKVEATECGGIPLTNVTPSTMNMQQKTSYRETYRDAQIAAFVFDYYSYYPGAAHGLPGRDAVIVDLGTGKALSMQDLFESKDYAAINAEILKQLKAMPEGEVFEDTLNAPDVSFVSENGCEACSLVLSKDKGLQVSFPPYAVGPYSSAFIDANIPKTFIKDSRVKNVVGK